MNHSNNGEIVPKILELLEDGSISRKDLSCRLGVGTTFISSVMSELISGGIVKEYVQTGTGSGRKATAFYLTHPAVFALVHITANEILTEFFGYDLKTLKTERRQITDPIFIDDCITSLLCDLSHLPREFSPGIRGIAFVCDGLPNESSFICSNIPGIDGIPILEMAREHLNINSCFLSNNSLASMEKSDGLNVIYCEKKKEAKLTIINDGAVLYGKNGLAGRIAGVSCQDSRIFGNRVFYSKNFDEYTSALSELFKNLIFLLNPDKMIIDTDRYSSKNVIIKTVIEKLMTEHRLDLCDIPSIMCEGDFYNPTMLKLRRNIRDSYVSNAFFDVR